MLAREIKDLSIACEALSRIQQSNTYWEVEKLLEKAVKRYQLENEAAPAKPKPTTDDEIPF